MGGGAGESLATHFVKQDKHEAAARVEPDWPVLPTGEVLATAAGRGYRDGDA